MVLPCLKASHQASVRRGEFNENKLRVHLTAKCRMPWPDMPDVEFSSAVQQAATELLVWVGFGTLVGLLAKAIMPGRDPGGTIATLMMGIGGTVIGCGILSYFSDKHISPISPLGFVVGTGGAFLLLFFYRLMGGYFFREGVTAPPPGTPHALLPALLRPPCSLRRVIRHDRSIESASLDRPADNRCRSCREVTL